MNLCDLGSHQITIAKGSKTSLITRLGSKFGSYPSPPSVLLTAQQPLRSGPLACNGHKISRAQQNRGQRHRSLRYLIGLQLYRGLVLHNDLCEPVSMEQLASNTTTKAPRRRQNQSFARLTVAFFRRLTLVLFVSLCLPSHCVVYPGINLPAET